ncbi:MAG: DUF3237 family protein [Lachnospiraceae bacterium]|nr:DUF3237 family protein [Lachnospiraceae bacterium]
MEIFRLYINVTKMHQIVSGDKCVNMLLFDGKCTGDYFQGSILSGGVDTQQVDLNGRGTLSARYMLEGVDREGTPCRIFIENNAQTGTENTKTKPQIFTDSESLKWLEREQLTGEILSEEGQLIISIGLEEKQR